MLARRTSIVRGSGPKGLGRRLWALLLLLAAVGEAGSSRPGLFRRLTVEDGLRHDAVYSLIQDRIGFMWFATEGGLERWDGHDFTEFPSRPFVDHTPSSEDASFVFEDSQGVLWVGTWGGGLERLDPRTGRFVHFRHDIDDPTSLSDDRIHTIVEDSTGELWISTFRGLSRYRPSADPEEGGFERFLHDPEDPSSLGHDRVWTVAEAPDGDLWLATDGGLDRWERTTRRFEHFQFDPSDARSRSVRTVFFDRTGTLWIGTALGLYSRGPAGAFRPWPRADGELESTDDPTNVVFEDSRGQLWVGTMRGGLGLLDRETGSWTWFRRDLEDRWSIAHDDIRDLVEDRSGLLWIATRGGGISLLELEPSPFALWTAEGGAGSDLPHEVVWSILEDTDGTFWVGTLGGLARIRGGSTKHFFHGAPDSRDVDDQTQALLRRRDGVLLVGTYGGLFTFDERAETFQRIGVDPASPSGTGSQRIQALFEDRSGHLWVGTRGGLYRSTDDGGSFERIRHDPTDPATLSDEFIWAIAEDRAGNLWVGTDVGGLSRFDPERSVVTRFLHDPSDPTSLSNNRVRAIVEDERGDLWVGTRLGLNRLDPRTGRSEHFFEEDGLPNASIHGLVPDATGKLWLSTNRGIARFDPVSRRVLRFGEADGLQGPIFSRSAFHRGPSGRIYFGGVKGLNAFLPEEIREEDRDPPLVLTGFQVRNEPRWLPTALPHLAAIQLRADQRSFEVEFAALDYSRRARTEYGYRLVGFDDDWVDAGSSRRATYTNLPPGRYTLEVRLAARDGGWRPVGLRKPIDLPPPLWGTWWFRLAVGVALALALAALYRLRMSRVRRHQRRLESLVAERTTEVEHQKAHLETIHQIVRLVNEPIALKELLGSLLEGISRLGGAEVGLLFVATKPDGALRIRAAVGIDPEPIEDETVDPEELVSRLCAATRPVTDGVLRGLPRADDLGGRLELAGRELLALRIRVGEEVVGWLVVASRRGELLAPRDVRTLVDLEDHVETAVAKALLVEELRELNAKKNEFLGIAAHDLRSPLGAIVGYADLLRRLAAEGRLGDATSDRFLGHIGTTARQMLDLVSRLLDVSAIESGRLDVELEPGRLDELLRERRELFAASAEHKQIRVVLDLGPNESIALMDRDRVREVVDNLLSNAIKFTPPGGTVRVRSEVSPSEILTHIEDDGPGLSASELAVAFTGRRLSPRPTAGEPSTGLGLVIVKKIVDLHGGRVWVESCEGAGSTFGFSLPRAS